jgi:hypothetical protein
MCSDGRRERRRASFETVPVGPPQDEVFLNAIKEVPHPEVPREARPRRTHDPCAQPHFANAFSSSQLFRPEPHWSLANLSGKIRPGFATVNLSDGLGPKHSEASEALAFGTGVDPKDHAT